MAADICATIANVNRDPKTSAYASDDFLRDWTATEETHRTPEEINELIRAHKAMANHANNGRPSRS